MFSAERKKCGTAEKRRPERSERETLPAVATTGLFAFLFLLEADETGRLLGQEGRLRYSLAPSVATAALRAADSAARRAGALGAKVCGAGGGGCLVAFAREGRRDDVAEAMARTGASLLTVRVARRGVAVSEP